MSWNPMRSPSCCHQAWSCVEQDQHPGLSWSWSPGDVLKCQDRSLKGHEVAFKAEQLMS